jgi:hypothetical protein
VPSPQPLLPPNAPPPPPSPRPYLSVSLSDCLSVNHCLSLVSVPGFPDRVVVGASTHLFGVAVASAVALRGGSKPLRAIAVAAEARMALVVRQHKIRSNESKIHAQPGMPAFPTQLNTRIHTGHRHHHQLARDLCCNDPQMFGIPLSTSG